MAAPNLPEKLFSFDSEKTIMLFLRVNLPDSGTVFP